MSQDIPFSHLFHLFGKSPENHVASINAEAYDEMVNLLSRPVEAGGRCILLRAPRAGYGKTHLLSGIQQRLASSHEFVLLQPADGYRVDPSAALSDVASRLTRSLPAGGGMTALDVLARKVFSLGLEPLVRSGEVPCQDRDAALHSLRNRAVETFDFHHSAAVTAQWARDNFEILGPRLVVEIAQIISAPMREVSFWVDALFRYAVTPMDQPGRAGMFMASVNDASTGSLMERLSTLLKLLSHSQRVVLVADELEGMSANEEAALRLAAFITALRNGADRVDFIISVNDDVWESAFLPRLSGGLQDRLSEAVVRLKPLSQEQALALLASRHPDAIHLMDKLSIDGDIYSRGLLRSAAALWARGDSKEVPNESVNQPALVVSPAIAEEIISRDEQPLAVAATSEPISEISHPTPSAEVYENPVVSHSEPIVEEQTINPFSATVTEPIVEASTFVADAPQSMAPLTDLTVAVPWKASDLTSIAINPEHSVIVPDKPVFVAPVVESVHTEEIQPQVDTIISNEPAPSPFSAIAASEPAIRSSSWWEERRADLSAVVENTTPIVPVSSDFGDPSSPFVTQQEILPTSSPVAQESPIPIEPSPYSSAPVYTAPVESKSYAQSPYQSTPSSAYNVPAVGGFEAPVVESTPPAFTPVAAVAESAYGVPSSTFAPTPSLTEQAEEAQQREIDRVDELLQQFRDRYGRS